MVFPQLHDRRDQEADRPRPDALRPRLRPARALPARVPAADLPDDAARPRRRLAGQAGHASTTSIELFKGILNPKQLEGLRLLVTPFPQQQFNLTDDRRSSRSRSRAWPASTATPTATPTRATHLVGDIRPQEHRHRIDTPSLRGVNIQRLFGSQRALKTVEDFTEFEQRAAYFDGDPATAAQEGRQPARARQPGALHGRVPEAARLPAGAEAGRVRQARPGEAPATPELRGEELFFGKAQCADLPPAAVLHRQH